MDLLALELDDPAVYALLQKGDTVGVFQLESEGMRRTLAAVRPTNFGDIIALVSLYRPGPMDNIPMFGARKNGREPIAYPHALLEGVLAETYGIFVYQEQVMQAAQVLAGYSLGQADLLRRAMGKKIKAEMDAQRAGFVEGCRTVNDIGKQQANELFDLIDKFAGYGFNKSHAAAYALLASCYGHLGRPDESRQAWEQALQLNPSFSIERRRRVLPFRNPEDFESRVEGLRKAGLIL